MFCLLCVANDIHFSILNLPGANSVCKSTRVTAEFLRGDALVLLARLEKDLVVPLQGDCAQAMLTAGRSGPRTVPTG